MAVNEVNGETSVVEAQPAPPPILSSFGLTRIYSGAKITLDNNVLPPAKLDVTPSSSDGVDAELERNLRFLGCELIQAASILLRLPQVAAATGQLLYQRFYYCKSFVRFDFEGVAMACVCLAGKIEESPRKLREVINVFNHLKQLRQNRRAQAMPLDQKYVNVKNEVKKHERRVLKELGFCVHVKHPHKLIFTYAKTLECVEHHELMQKAWNYMNDLLRTDLFLRYTSETIACACIYLSTRNFNVPLPNKWWEAFDADETDLVQISGVLLQLYALPRPSWPRLDKAIGELRERYEKAKLQQQTTPSRVQQHEGSGGEGTPKMAASADKFSPSQSSRNVSPRSKTTAEKGVSRATASTSGAGRHAGGRSAAPKRRSRHSSGADSPASVGAPGDDARAFARKRQGDERRGDRRPYEDEEDRRRHRKYRSRSPLSPAGDADVPSQRHKRSKHRKRHDRSRSRSPITREPRSGSRSPARHAGARRRDRPMDNGQLPPLPPRSRTGSHRRDLQKEREIEVRQTLGIERKRKHRPIERTEIERVVVVATSPLPSEIVVTTARYAKKTSPAGGGSRR